MPEPASAAAKPAAASGTPDGTPPGFRPHDRRRRPVATATGAGTTSLVAVTACPTGIAHTYMAAEALEAAAERAGVELHVETQGSAGVHAARRTTRSPRPAR